MIINSDVGYIIIFLPLITIKNQISGDLNVYTLKFYWYVSALTTMQFQTSQLTAQNDVYWKVAIVKSSPLRKIEKT